MIAVISFSLLGDREIYSDIDGSPRLKSQVAVGHTVLEFVVSRAPLGTSRGICNLVLPIRLAVFAWLSEEENKRILSSESPLSSAVLKMFPGSQRIAAVAWAASG